MRPTRRTSGRHVELRSVTRTFHKAGVAIDVLRGVDLELLPGNAVALLGQSGSGKSTLLHILGGLEPPTQGEVRIDGTNLYARPAAELDRYRNADVGFIFQFHHLLPDHDAATNVAMPAIIRGVPPKQARETAEERLDAVGLAHRIHHKPGELSGGEQQRVAIARALVNEPGLVLADEPTGNLDPATASAVLDMLLERCSTLGATLVTVTHSIELAGRFPRRLRLREGRLEEAA
jgi:lipoprotein-releasing system ATP-binding protein